MESAPEQKSLASTIGPLRESGRQVTSLLTNQQLARLEQLRLAASRRFTNRSRGEHQARRSGSSTDFNDYRDYSPGDDIRHVDWNIFARLHRPYIKLYLEEEQMHVVLLVDASSSMIFEQKLLRAKQLAAAFGVMSLMGGEPVSAAVFNQAKGRISRLRPHTGRGSMRQLFAFLEQIEGGGDGPLEAGIDALLREHRGRGVIVIVSDFLTTGDLKRAHNLLFSRGLEVFGIQILSPTEIDPEMTGDIRMVDCETTQALDVSAAGDLVNIYHEYRLAYQRNLEQLCQQRSGRFVSIGSNDPLDNVLFDLLRRRGWVR